MLFTYFLLFLSFCANVELVLFFRRKIVADLLKAKEQDDRKAGIRVENLHLFVILTFLYSVEFAFLKMGREIGTTSVSFPFLIWPTKLSSQVKKQTQELAQKAFGKVYCWMCGPHVLLNRGMCVCFPRAAVCRRTVSLNSQWQECHREMGYGN